MPRRLTWLDLNNEDFDEDLTLMTPATIFKERRLARGLLRKESCHSEKPRDFGPIIDPLIALIVIKEFYIEDACKNNATENYKFVQKI